MRSIRWLALGFVVLLPAYASPCDCAVVARDLSEALDAGATTVFEGTLERPVEWPMDGGQSVTYALRVTRAWRGVDAGSEVRVTTSTSDCGVHVAERVPTLVAAPAGEGGVVLAQCRRDVWVSTGAQLAKDRARLGPASSEAPAPSRTPPPRKAK